MPMPVVNLVEMRRWEQATWATGRTEAEIIRRVGQQVAVAALCLTQSGDAILILAGKGHNGDDARQAREHLSDRRVEMLEVKDPKNDRPRLAESLSGKPALIIDGLFGIGLNRPLDRNWIGFIRQINEAECRVLAVDVPSGLSAETGEPQGAAIMAAMTLTVGAPKIGLLQPAAWPYVGRLEVAHDVGLAGIPAVGALNWTLPEDFSGFPPRRPVAGHKGTFGHLAIVAGSLGYHGAAVLAARGAQRARPGLVTLFPQESAYIPTAAQLQAVMVQPWSADVNLPGEFSACVVGPGLAADTVPEDLQLNMRHLWLKAPVPVVVDASALAWLPRGAARAKAIRVITPHPGEAARLLKTTAAAVQADRVKALRKLSKQFGDALVVLKGHQTLVGRSDGPVFVNSSGNPALAQGGSGDVLAGFLAGLLAQPALQRDALRTVRYAVWRHGATADALEAGGKSWVIEDFVAALGAARKSRA